MFTANRLVLVKKFRAQDSTGFIEEMKFYTVRDSCFQLRVRTIHNERPKTFAHFRTAFFGLSQANINT